MSSKVKIKLDRKGVGALLKSEEVMTVLKEEADSRAATAGEGYGVNTYVGKNRCNAEIKAETHKARQDNLKNNTLLRLIS